MRTASFRLPVSARALSMALACLLALGALAPSVSAGGFSFGDRAIVTESVHWQFEPGVDAHFTVPAGDDVVVLDGPVNGSYYIAWGEERGWLAAWALAPMDGGTAAPAAVESAPAAPSAPVASFDLVIYSPDDLYGQLARVASSAGVNLRDAPNHGANVLTALSNGALVELRIYEADTVYDPDGVTRWWPVTANGQVGWVSGSFLTSAGTAAAPPAAPEPEPEPAAAPEAPTLAPARFVVGDYIAAQTPSGGGVNIREAASMDSARLGIIAETGTVQIIDGPVYDGAGNVWFVINDGATTGYVLGDLFVASSAPPPPPPPEPEPQPEPEPAPAPPAPAAGVANGYFIWPTNGTISQGYGCSSLPFYPYDANLGCPFHNGLDIAAPPYTPIVASDGGIVTAAGWGQGGLGYYVAIDHGNGFETIYGHMAEQPYVGVGQAVSQGQHIGPIGSTGVSTGPHIHFMIRLNGSTVDPLAYLS